MVKYDINVVCVSNRGLDYLPNIINNYKRQSYEFKRLHIIFNSKVNKDDVENYIKESKIENYFVSYSPSKTLGECLNYSIKKMPEEYAIWCKMDDDDYYGKNYIMHNLEGMLKSKCLIVGRSCIFVYIPETKKVVIKNNGGVSKRTKFVYGATLFIDRKVFSQMKFPTRNSGEDSDFLRKANKKRIMIYSSTMNDFISIRHLNSKFHTWKTNKFFIGCKTTTIKLPDDFKEHIFS